jgi:hypothetical protein
MFYTISDDLVLYQILKFIKKYTNSELKLYKYFHSKTGGISPEFVAIIDHFIFFFVKNEYYFDSKTYLDSMRREIKGKKILIVRAENVLINFLFSLFPDLYIHNISLEINDFSGKREITIYFLTYKERGIAIGRGAEYIRSVNKLFIHHIIFENKSKLIEIRCKNLTQYCSNTIKLKPLRSICL